MKLVKVITALVVGVCVSGCADLEAPSQNVSFPQQPQLLVEHENPSAKSLGSDDFAVAVREINISVPDTLKVSEANLYYPPGDIVWRGDPVGNRHMQVKAIFEEGVARGTSQMSGSTDVILNVEVERFHSVSEKTRYTFGGIHSIRFSMTLHDAKTGRQIAAPKTVKANLKAYGGQAAVDADRQGQTQKVRIIAHLANVIQQELGLQAGTETPTVLAAMVEKETF